MIILLFLAICAVLVLIELGVAWVFAHHLLNTVPYLSSFGTEDWFRVIVALSILTLIGTFGSRSAK